MGKQRKLVLGLVAAVALIAAACGNDDDAEPPGAGAEPADDVDDADEAAESDGDGPDELVPVTVGILPVADLAPLYYGIEQGFFEEEGLDLTTEVGQGGAALVPAVETGEMQFAFGNYVSLMLARQNAVGVQIVSHVVSGADTPDRGTNALLVAPDSGIEGIDDLAGRTFAVSTLNNVGEVNVRSTLINNGVDDSDIEFIEMPFPDMNAAVEAGEVDVAWTAEPFITLGEAAGLVNIGDPMFETMPSLPLAGMFASEAWLEDNPEVAEGFFRAMQRSLEAGENESAMRDAIIANTETPPDVVPELALANWEPELNTDNLTRLGELAADFEIVDAEPDVDELVWAPAAAGG